MKAVIFLDFLKALFLIRFMKVKIMGGQKMDEGVKISKSNILPIMLEMVDLHSWDFMKKIPTATCAIRDR